MKFSGKFITFEGPEGAGKSTHTKLLCEYLRKKGRDIVYVREPGSTRIGEKIRGILLDDKNKEISDITEMCLYMASRAQLVKEIILPALGKGKIVISDRFQDATIAYQGYGGGIDVKLIKGLGKAVTYGLVPDLTVLLDNDLDKGLNQQGKVKDRIENKPLAYHKKVHFGYMQLAQAEPKRIKIVRQDDDVALTQDKIRKLVDKIL
ncbi:MAG: dTMP kinase [Candidatus Omnitrophica bacterium CG11_big_fil_rev_8_21_14_0_20_42_13]|uniref:Thymidylate kinase n=1 Tax=Candidatus Ghiorseimicrobium undicola TaxID=1974746 RepID=A0A2H0LVZ8_9BACT|nr:MAG: dTMP kinase [Candidatus Omnitrophica bacterium CG11_big_fil_rev_8_21_14_0_20_42_13]